MGTFMIALMIAQGKMDNCLKELSENPVEEIANAAKERTKFISSARNLNKKLIGDVWFFNTSFDACIDDVLADGAAEISNYREDFLAEAKKRNWTIDSTKSMIEDSIVRFTCEASKNRKVILFSISMYVQRSLHGVAEKCFYELVVNEQYGKTLISESKEKKYSLLSKFKVFETCEKALFPDN